MTELDVPFPIADHDRRRRTETQVRSRPCQQAKGRFSADATRVGCVRAVINPLESGPHMVHHNVQARVHFLEAFECKESPAHPGLVRDDNQTEIVGIQPFQPFRCAWFKFQSLRIIQVSAINHQGPVAIKDDDLVGCACDAHEPKEPATRLTVSLVLWPVTSSASTTFPPRPITKSAPTTLSSV